MEYVHGFMCLLTFNLIIQTEQAKVTKITVKENSAANFILPASQDCGEYTLTDSSESLVLTISIDGVTTISSSYVRRSTAASLKNGTIVYTLHYVSWRDEGTFATQTLNPDCQWYFTLTLLKDDPTIAYWERWGSWSECSTTCGSGMRTRDRQCNRQDRCNGLSREADECETSRKCPFWGTWSKWTSCSVTCGSGEHTRRRDCNHGDNGKCDGDSSQSRPCTMKPCALWGSWDSWTSCSVTCGAGERTRRRNCNHGVPGDCVGQSANVQTCTMRPCADWATWSEWSSCSTSCGTGQADRRRLCWMDTNRVYNNQCPGDSIETKSCTTARPCEGSQYLWSSWSEWSPCSKSCGTGNQARMRNCLLHDTQQNIQDVYCGGRGREVHECHTRMCLGEVGRTHSGVVPITTSATDAQSDSSVDNNKPGSSMPLTTIVGGAAAGFIIVLLLVIIVLLVRMRRHKDATGRRRTIYDLANRQSKQVDLRVSMAKSNAGRSETESRMYAEIDSDFLDSEFDATSCNDYGPLPTSASPRGTANGTKKSSIDQTTDAGNVFTFDASAINAGGQTRTPKISVISRSGNVDTDGYEKPVTCVDRQRKMVYANVAYNNISK